MNYSLLLGLAVLPAFALAQSLERPVLSVGDHWVYRHVERMSGSHETSREFRVVEKLPDGYRIESIRSDRAEPVTGIYDLDLNLEERSADGGRLPRRDYSWPLTPGKTWPLEYTEDSAAHSDRRYTYRLKARVEGVEKVTVPAGTFDTVRVRVSGSYTRSNDNRSAPVDYIFWYSPEVKRAVRTHYQRGQFTTRVRENDFLRELTSYKVAP